MSSLRRGHANLLCIVPILADDLFRGSEIGGRTQNEDQSLRVSVHYGFCSPFRKVGQLGFQYAQNVVEYAKTKKGPCGN